MNNGFQEAIKTWGTKTQLTIIDQENAISNIDAKHSRREGSRTTENCLHYFGSSHHAGHIFGNFLFSIASSKGMERGNLATRGPFSATDPKFDSRLSTSTTPYFECISSGTLMQLYLCPGKRLGEIVVVVQRVATIDGLNEYLLCQVPCLYSLLRHNDIHIYREEQSLSMKMLVWTLVEASSSQQSGTRGGSSLD